MQKIRYQAVRLAGRLRHLAVPRCSRTGRRGSYEYSEGGKTRKLSTQIPQSGFQFLELAF